MSRKSLARQAANNRAFAFGPTKPTRPAQPIGRIEAAIQRHELREQEAIALIGYVPTDAPNYYETLPDSDPAQRDIRHLAVELLIQRDGAQCYLCKTDLTPRRACIEHIIPLGFGGENTPANIALACYPCNIRKGTFYVSLAVSSGKPCYHRPRT